MAKIIKTEQDKTALGSATRVSVIEKHFRCVRDEMLSMGNENGRTEIRVATVGKMHNNTWCLISALDTDKVRFINYESNS